ncbi:MULTISPECIES: fluoride efflux transporter CrcB [unclassified Streptomyces]|uniref:fluoride efflux transporter CrcB n=1 Tax=unclassified Streptomyces TaxID=2593676 RepID=UPI000DB90663|nr:MULTISPECIES: fluoride efflux transporter CrcB [unclassified Streptomyces]MYT73864.1 fluoride efflux transporter CrcB [Streptomyces sp. SID8367]
MPNEPVETAQAAPARPVARRAAPWREQGPVIGVVAVGGAVGACARYGAALLWPTASGAFPWTTLWVNVVGCAVMGVFMVLITEVWQVHRLVRPFFGTGVLGGFTTFSTYAVDIRTLTDGDEARIALGYLALTVCLALTAVWTATHLARRVVARVRRTGGTDGGGAA